MLWQMGYFVIATFLGAYPFVRQPLVQQPRVEPRLAGPPIVLTRPKIALKPGQACAIPLLNVLRRTWGYDRMAVPAPRARRSSPDIIAPPAPSCDDVK